MTDDTPQAPQGPNDDRGTPLLWCSIIGAAIGCVIAFVSLAGTYGPSHADVGGTFLGGIVFGAIIGALFGTILEGFRE